MNLNDNMLEQFLVWLSNMEDEEESVGNDEQVEAPDEQPLTCEQARILAVSFKRLFDAYIEAGFTENQALCLLSFLSPNT